jgi:hypothetical protein
MNPRQRPPITIPELDRPYTGFSKPTDTSTEPPNRLLHQATSSVLVQNHRPIHSTGSVVSHSPESIESALFSESDFRHKHYSEFRTPRKFSQASAILTEKHLKQYDALLAVKDQRLKETSLDLDYEKQMIEEERISIAQDKERIELERRENAAEKVRIKEEREEIEEKLSELETKRLELEMLSDVYYRKRTAFSEISSEKQETSPSELLICRETEIKELFNELYSYKLKASEQKSDDYYNSSINLKEFEEKFLMLQKKEKELLSFEETLQRIKDQMLVQQQMSSEIIENKVRELKSREIFIGNQRQQVLEAQELLAREAKVIERIALQIRKKSDLSSPEEIERMIASLQEQPFFPSKLNLTPLVLNEIKEAKTEENTLMTNTDLNDEVFLLKANIAESESKLSTACHKISELEQEKEELLARLNQKKSFKTVATMIESDSEKGTQKLNGDTKEKMLKQKIEQLESVIEVQGGKLQKQLSECLLMINELERKLSLSSAEIKRLEANNKELSLQNAFLVIECEENVTRRGVSITEPGLSSSRSHSNASDVISELRAELEARLSQVKAKEKGLEELQTGLLKEKEEIEKAAQCVKAINDDITAKQELLKKERNSIMSERLRITLQMKTLDERTRNIEIQEQEIAKARIELDERDKYFYENQRSLAHKKTKKNNS